MEMVKHRMEGTSSAQPSSSRPDPWPPAEYTLVRPTGHGRNQVCGRTYVTWHAVAMLINSCLQGAKRSGDAQVQEHH